MTTAKSKRGRKVHRIAGDASNLWGMYEGTATTACWRDAVGLDVTTDDAAVTCRTCLAQITYNGERHAGTDHFCQMIGRLLRAYPRRMRSGDSDVTALEQLAEIQRELDEQTRQAVAVLREQGVSWAQIAEHLGMNRTAAYNKFEARTKKAS